MSVVTPFEPKEPTSMRLATPMAMLDRAIEQGASIEILTSLMDLAERKEKALNRQAFDQAIAAAKAEIPVVIKNRNSHNGKYADFAQYARTLDPILPKFGLSYRFRTTQTDRILVTCILSHRDGHFEENSLSGPTDTSGSKTPIQSIGSTQSYLMRYSLIAALGLASAEDDDGNGSSGGRTDTINENQENELAEALDLLPAGSEARLLKSLGVEELSSIPSAKFEVVLRSVKNKAAK